MTNKLPNSITPKAIQNSPIVDGSQPAHHAKPHTCRISDATPECHNL